MYGNNSLEFNIRYIVTKGYYLTSDAVKYTSFGISAIQDGVTVASVNDISTSIKEIEALADDCNRLRLDPIHLTDIVRDYIMEKGFSRE